MKGFLAAPGAGWSRGAQGVRAGWRLLLFVAVLLVLVVGFISLVRVTAGAQLRGVSQLSAGGLALQEVLVLVPLLGATAVMGWLEGETFARYGLAKRQASGLGGGFAAGFVAIAALMAVLYGAGWASSAAGGAGWRDGLAWGLTCLLIGAMEEMLFRGYVLQALARGIGFWPAAVVTSLAFAAAHMPNHHELPFSMVTTTAAALVFCFSIRRTGALWWAIGFHAGWDYAESYVFGTMDSGYRLLGSFLFTNPRGPVLLSGGSSGPEGSVLCLAVLAVVAAILARQATRS